MPRNSSGTYTLPAGNPVVTATTVSTTWANTTLGDLATEITDSASRSGKGGFTAPIRAPDGTVAAPAVAFTSEPNTGLYRAGTGDVRVALSGVDAAKITPITIQMPAATFTALQATGANASLGLYGNKAAADTGADVTATSTVTRTAGYLFAVVNNGANALLADFHGLLTLANQAAAIQPASLWTAITPDTGITAVGGLGFFKDAIGVVHMRGGITNNTGSPVLNLNATNPIPAGFQPSVQRNLIGSSGGATGIGLNLLATGVIQVPTTLPAGASVYFDSLTYIAEK